jgi:Radical SAM superfamily
MSVKPMVMPYAGKDVPHVVIEVNQKCNIRCLACYKDKYGYTKPLQQIKDEIDIACRERNLSMLSLAGGEPSLHPQLDEVIAYAAGKGLTVQMLSNGYALSDEQLSSYKAAGLYKVYLHVDSLQRRSDAPENPSEQDLHELRERIAERVRRHGLHVALAVTLYRKNLDELRSVVDFVLGSPDYHRMLATCCTDFREVSRSYGEFAHEPDPAAPGEDLNTQAVRVSEAKAELAEMGMHPFGYVASSESLDEQRWLLLYSFTILQRDGGRSTLHLGPTFKRVVTFSNWLSKRRKGRYPFGRLMSQRGAIVALLLYAVTSLSLLTALRTLRFMLRLTRSGAEIHQKSFVFQQGPNVTANGDIEICKDCPDATIRNGKLVPLCMADFISPAEGDPEQAERAPSKPGKRRPRRPARVLLPMAN